MADDNDKKKDEENKTLSPWKLAAVGVLGGILALGTPFLIGVFAIALTVGIIALGKKIYDYNHKDMVNELNEKGKELNNGKESKDNDKINDLANSKNLDELNEKLSKTISEFSKTKEGQALINNEKFQAAVKNACGVDIKDIVKAAEKQDVLSIAKEKEEIEKPKVEEEKKEEPKPEEKKPEEKKIEEPNKEEKKPEEEKKEEPKPEGKDSKEKEAEESKKEETKEETKETTDSNSGDDSSPNEEVEKETEVEDSNDAPTNDGAGSKIISGLKTAAKAVKKGATKVAGAAKKAVTKDDKKSNASKGNGNKEKSKEEDKDKGISADTVKKMFMIFVIGMFLFGAPLTIGLFALGLAAVAGYKIYDWKKNSPTKMARDAINGAKEADLGPLPNKYGDYLDLAKNEKGEPATEEEFAKNLMNKVNEFANTKEGQELLNDPNFKKMFTNIFKEDPAKVAENVDKTLENIEKNKNELENPDLEKDDYVPAKDVTEEYKDILEELDKDEELEKPRYEDVKDKEKEPSQEIEMQDFEAVDDAKQNENIEIDDKNSINSVEPTEDKKELLDIPDDEFPETNPVATQEEVQNSLEASKETSMENSLDIEDMMRQNK